MCSFCKNQIPSFRYFIIWKQAYSIWKLSMEVLKNRKRKFSEIFTVVLTNQDLLILI